MAFTQFNFSTHSVRSFGSAAMALCYVANCIIVIYTTEGLKPWDLAAGALIVTEAGGSITLINGN